MARRSISNRERARLFALHGGKCHICGAKIDGVRERWEVSHDRPLALGGEDDDANRKPAHYRCHRILTETEDIPRISKAKRQEAAYRGSKRSASPLPGSKAHPSGLRKRMNGQVERW